MSEVKKYGDVSELMEAFLGGIKLKEVGLDESYTTNTTTICE